MFLNQGTAFGWTPLMAATDEGQLEACRWLLKNRAQVNTSMSTWWTAMHSAAKKGFSDIVALLLESNGNKNIMGAHREFGKNLMVEDVTTEACLTLKTTEVFGSNGSVGDVILVRY